MKIYKSFKFRLYPNKGQKSFLYQHCGNTRFVWNKLLEYNQKYYQKVKKFKFKYDMITSLPKLKEEYEFLKLSFSQSLQQVGMQLDKALKDNFQKTKGFPKFKKKSDNNDSFAVPQYWKLYKDSVYIPKIGKVKWKKHRNLQGKPKHITISQCGGQWHCSVTCELEIQKKQKSTNNIIGIDVGLEKFATFSNNMGIKRKRILNKYSHKLKKEQRRLSKKVKDSNNRKKQIIKVQSIHRKIKNIRKDFLHKETHNMITKYSGFALEDLNIKGMMKNHKLARSISDVSWYEFNRILEYKSLWNSKYFIKINRFEPTSKRCNSCGNIKEDLTLKDREYNCDSCGITIDRDLNASKNILAEGLNILYSTLGNRGSNDCGDDKVHFSSEKKKKVIVCETVKRKTG